MSADLAEDWYPILSRLNAVLLKSDRWRNELRPEARSTGWCGAPPASEGEIVFAEERLGTKLPPSYRSFLSISNGWRPFNSFVERLLRIQEIERFCSADPEDLALIQKYYREDDISDEAYLDYRTPRRNVALRHRYYPDSLLIGKKWPSGGGELVLLNPHIVSPGGEWETIFFANWVPGNERYPSFRDFVKESVSDEEAS